MNGDQDTKADTVEKPGVPAEEPGPKAPWNKPVLVPLSVSLTEHTPGVGSDGDVFPDSTRP